MPRYADDDDSDEYDAYRDYDPDVPETYPQGLYDDDGPPLVPCRIVERRSRRTASNARTAECT